MTDPVPGPDPEASPESGPQPAQGSAPERGSAAGASRSLRTAPDSVTVRLGRHLDHPPAAVWAACTEPARLSHWFGEVGPVVDGDGTNGGLHLGASAWLWSPDAADGGRITVLDCDPPRRLVIGWSYAEEPASRVELRLAPAGGGSGTDLVLEHTGAGGFEGPEHGAGWETFLAALDVHLATGAGDPADLRWGLLETSLQEVWLALVPGSGR